MNQYNRQKYSPKDQVMLLSQVDRLCPLCCKPLYEFKNDKWVSLFELAHIYPHSATQNEIQLLENEERLTSDVDDVDNIIPLCPSCHTRYDKEKTVNDYRKLVQIKKKFISDQKYREQYSNYIIDQDINAVIDLLADGSILAHTSPLDTKLLKIEEKANDTLEPLTKLEIKQYATLFYNQIKEKFQELDSENENTFNLIANQIKTFYLELKKTEKNQSIIYEKVSEWIYMRTQRRSLGASKIITSFFIQNCEVLS